MPERYRSDKRTMGQLLSLSSPPIEVSSIQRDYSWDPSHVRTFWEDLLSFADTLPADLSTDQEYFLGSVVMADKTKGTGYLLIDGQQRLATATILLSVIILPKEV
jgi:uncharacterized protein with ParB-like and HNH nuclease domain